MRASALLRGVAHRVKWTGTAVAQVARAEEETAVDEAVDAEAEAAEREAVPVTEGRHIVAGAAP